MPVLEDGKQFEKLTCQYAIKPMPAVRWKGGEMEKCEVCPPT